MSGKSSTKLEERLQNGLNSVDGDVKPQIKHIFDIFDVLFDELSIRYLVYSMYYPADSHKIPRALRKHAYSNI